MKKITKRLITFALVLTLILAGLPAFSLNFSRAAENDIPTNSNIRSDIGIDNGQFSTTSSSYPVSPDSWTGSFMNSASGTASVKTGVVNLKPSVLQQANKDNALKLDSFNFTGGRPETIFGYDTVTYPGTNTNALMINSYTNQSAYAYTMSSSKTLEANKYYEFKVWVMTSDFDNDTGAYIRFVADDLTVLNQTFGPINTYNKGNKGWVEYKFYLETPSYKSINVNISLQLGNYVATNEDGKTDYSKNLAKGVAFFDNISGSLISRGEFDTSMKSDTVIVHSMKDYVAYDYTNQMYNDYGDPAKENTSAFYNTDFESGMKGWSWYSPGTTSSAGVVNTYSFDEVKLGDNPESPFGRSSVLMLRNTSASHNVVKSNPFTVERHRTYRLSMWYKTNSIESGSAMVRLRYTPDENSSFLPGNNTVDTTDITKEVTCSTSGGDNYYNGWSEAVIFIQGSSFSDKELTIELSLGADKDSTAKGTVYFDDLNLEYVNTSDFSTQASDPMKFETFDNNNTFDLAGNYKEYKYPLLPKDWTGGYAGEASLSRPGTTAPENQDVITGIIGTDTKHFDQNVKNGNYGKGAINPTSGLVEGNMLYIYSQEPTAYGYSSTTFEVPADGYLAITVKMSADITSDEGGANLVLKSGSTVLAIIKDITDSVMRDYKFIIEGASAAKSVAVEIWLGLADGAKNDTALASGHVYADFVLTDSESVTSDNYAAAQNAVRTKRFTFKNENFEAFEDSDSLLKTPYTWDFVTSNKFNYNTDISKGGIFNGRGVNQNSELNAIGFTHENEASPYVMAINNPAPTAAYMKSSLTHPLNADSWYQVKVRLKTMNIMSKAGYESGNSVYNNDGSINYSEFDMDKAGAMLKLTGTDGVFKSINTERKLKSHEKNDYKDYIFYVQTSSTATEVGFEIWLGNDEYTYLFTSGWVFVDNIIIDSITETQFAEYTAIIDEEADLEEDEKTATNIMRLILSQDSEDSTDDTTDGGNNFPWWGIPSILLAVTIFVALIGFTLRKFWPQISRLFKRRKNTSVDRDQVLETIHARNMDKIRREKLGELSGEDDEFNENEAGEENPENEESAGTEETGDKTDDSETSETDEMEEFDE